MIEAGLTDRSRLPRTLSDDQRKRFVNLRYVLTCSLLIAPLVAVASGLSTDLTGAAIALVAFCLLASSAGIAMGRHYPHSRLGLANIVTLSRSAIIAALFAPLGHPGILAQNPQLAWVVLGIAIFCLCLDGLDGYFARRQGLTSEFGARFDMEVDSVFALLLALLAWQSGKAGMWVLVLGGMRYLFLVAGLALPWLMAPLPERFTRKAICVVQILVLIALLAPIMDGPLSWTVAAIATLLLTYSFGRDVDWLARHRS